MISCIYSMARCGETILRTGFAVQQHRQFTSAVCVFACVFVCVFLGLCGGRRVSCHSIHAATANNWVTESKKRPTHFTLPFYNACCSALPEQEENLNAWMMSYPVPWLHGFQGSPVQKAKKPISMAIRYPAWLWVWFSCHTLEFATLLCTLRKEALMWLFVCSL